MITLLVTSAALGEGEVRVGGEPYRHLFRARRVERGARLRLVDGLGGARWAEVVEIGRSEARLVVGDPAPSAEPGVRLELWVAALRRERASWLVEKATELGVSAIRFFSCERTPRRLGEGTLERLERVAAAALEQSHGSRLPAVSGFHPFREVVEAAGASPSLVLDPAAGTSLAEDLGADFSANLGAGATPTEKLAAVIGPEGGLTAAEVAELEAAGSRRRSLGERILRVETAAIAVAAVVMALARREV